MYGGLWCQDLTPFFGHTCPDFARDSQRWVFKLRGKTAMDIAKLILEYISATIWPFVTLILAFRFYDAIVSLIPKSKINFTIAGVTVETSLAELEQSVSESLRGENLSSEQWDWLRKLKDSGRTPYDHKYYMQLRPLRNSGLIREYPEGWLSNSEAIEITTLGRLLLDAHNKK